MKINKNTTFPTKQKRREFFTIWFMDPKNEKERKREEDKTKFIISLAFRSVEKEPVWLELIKKDAVQKCMYVENDTFYLANEAYFCAGKIVKIACFLPIYFFVPKNSLFFALFNPLVRRVSGMEKLRKLRQVLTGLIYSSVSSLAVSRRRYTILC